MKKIFTWAPLALILLSSCFAGEENNEAASSDSTSVKQEVNLYSHRHYDIDKEIYSEFEKETGIKVNVIEDDADKLMVRMENEGDASPCDLLITSDVGRLLKAKEKGLLQSVSSEVLSNSIPANLRDSDNQWFSLTMRARVIVYAKDKVKEGEIKDMEDLAKPAFKGKVLIRSSDNVYNQSLVASLIAHLGKDAVLDWAKGIVANMAREPKGGDRDQVKEIAAGTGTVAVVNTYYMGKMLNSDDAEEKKAAENVVILFPNQENRGTHVNISGAGVAKNSPNKDNAMKLLEYLISEKVQSRFAEANFEYPVNPAVQPASLLQGWGEFKQDSLPLSEIGKHQQAALEVFTEAGWK